VAAGAASCAPRDEQLVGQAPAVDRRLHHRAPARPGWRWLDVVGVQRQRRADLAALVGDRVGPRRSASASHALVAAGAGGADNQ
jgi:hypothetical protein